MKLTREDFRNYIKDYDADEIFYRDFIFRKKIIRKLFITTV